MDLGALFRLRKAWNTFSGNHPKFSRFLHAVVGRPVEPEMTMEITMTYPDGTKYESSIRVQESDIELMDTLKDIMASAAK